MNMKNTKHTKAAELALQSIERNQELIVSFMRRVDGRIAGVTHTTFEGWKRNLAKARTAIRRAKGEADHEA